MQTEWRDVVGLEDYFKVSKCGLIFSKRTHKILKPTKCKNGYLYLCTKIGGRAGRALSLRINRIVAEAWLENPSIELIEQCKNVSHGKVVVRHLDDNKENNHYLNLAWGTHQDNT